MENRKSIRYALIFICSILSSMALLMDKTYLPKDKYLHQFGGYMVEKMNCNNFTYLVVLIAFFCFYYKFFPFLLSLKKHLMPILLAFLLGGILMIGDGFSANERLTFMIDNSYQFIASLITYVGYVLLLYIVICYLDSLYDRYCAGCQIGERRELKDKKLYFRLFVLLLICWSPYLIAYFPGSVPHDGMVQIAQAMDAYILKNDHPVLCTLFLGMFTKFGRLVSNDYIGIFLEILTQTLFVAAAFAFLLYRVFEYSRNKILLITAALALGVYPTWGMLVESFIKDTFYVGFFTIFAVLYVDFIMNPSKFTKKAFHMAGLVLSMLGLCLWRNNGVHILLGTFVLLLTARVKWFEKLKVSACFFLVFISYFSVLNVLYPAMGIPEEGNAPEINVCLQQTGRYLKMHEDEVTEEEKAAISGVVDYDYLLENYNPNNNDYAKMTYNRNAPKEAQNAYRKVWFQMFKKHPITYIEATLNTTYNYYYFGNNIRYMGEYQNYTKYEANFCLPGLKEIPWLSGFRNLMSSWGELVRAIPGINLLGRCGFYTWILLILTGIFLKNRNWNKIVAMAPLWVNVLLFCLLSPINGLQRYDWPVMAAIPLCVALLFTSEQGVSKKRGKNYELDERGMANVNG